MHCAGSFSFEQGRSVLIYVYASIAHLAIICTVASVNNAKINFVTLSIFVTSPNMGRFNGFLVSLRKFHDDCYPVGRIYSVQGRKSSA